MKTDFIELKEEFTKIKALGAVKSLRGGSTGIGYTFESLLNKAEDQEGKPDFKSIEIKCKLGYSNTPITLFNCAPKRHGIFATSYIFKKYGYHRYNNINDYIMFERTVYAHNAYKLYDYEFRLKVDYYKMEVIMQSYHNGVYLEDVCSWDFKILNNKLQKKLTNLAIVYGYPYKYDNELYYKYFKIDFYRLRGFFEFLNLIDNDIISVNFYKKEGKTNFGTPRIDTHGVSFKINKENISKLFYKVQV